MPRAKQEKKPKVVPFPQSLQVAEAETGQVLWGERYNILQKRFLRTWVKDNPQMQEDLRRLTNTLQAWSISVFANIAVEQYKLEEKKKAAGGSQP